MKPYLKLAGICYLGFVIYCISLFISGDTGLERFGQRYAYRDHLISNIEELDQLQEEFSTELKNLRKNEEKNVLLARKLGYFSRYEVQVFSSLSSSGSESLNIGRILQDPVPPEASGNRQIWFISAAISLIAGALVFAVRKKTT